MPQTFSFEEALQEAPQPETFSFEEAVASPTPPIGELRLRPPPIGVRSTISGGPPVAPAPLGVTAPELAEEAGQTLGRATEPLVPFTKIVPEGPMRPVEALGAAVLAPKLSAMFGPETPVAAGREAARAVLGIPEFATTPVGMATGGLAATGKLAQTLVSLGFAADMAVSLVRQGAEVIPNWKNMTYPERARAIVQAVSTGALGGLLTAHGVKGVREMVAPKPPVIPPFTPEQQAADVEARRAMVPRPGQPSRTPIVEDYFEPTQPEPAKPVIEPEKTAADIIEQAREVLPKAAEEAAKVVPERSPTDAALRNLGYSDEQIGEMTPAQKLRLFVDKTKKAEPSAQPERPADASEVEKAAEVYGDVRPLGQPAEKLPVQESGKGIQPQAEGGIQPSSETRTARSTEPEVLLKPEPPVPQPKEPAAKTGEGETPISRIDRELQGQWVTPAIKGELTRRRAAIVEGQSKGQRYVPYRHSDIGSNRWSVVDTTTGNQVEFPVTIQHPERGEIRTTRLAFQTKKQALDAIQAQSPPVKMQSEVQKVSKTAVKTPGERAAEAAAAKIAETKAKIEAAKSKEAPVVAARAAERPAPPTTTGQSARWKKIQTMRSELDRRRGELEDLQREKAESDLKFRTDPAALSDRDIEADKARPAKIKDLEDRIREIENELGVERWRAEYEDIAAAGKTAGPGTQRITSEMLDAQKENLLSQVDEALKTAPKEGKATISFKVPGDGTFTVTNNKAELGKFRELAEEKFPATVPKVSEEGEMKGRTMLKVSRGEPKEIGKLIGDFVSDDPQREVINSAYSDGTQIVATDGRQLVRIVTEKAPGSPTAPVRISNKGTVLKESKGNYPNFNRIRPKSLDLVRGGMDTGELWHIARQALTFRDISVEKDKRAQYSLRISLNPDGSLGGYMDIQGDIFQHNLQEGSKVIGSYNPEYLESGMKLARKLGNETVDCYVDGQEGPLVFIGKNHEQLIMPMRGEAGIGRAQPSEFSRISGKKTVPLLSEGLGPLPDPEMRRSEVVDIGKNKFAVVLESGKVTLQKATEVYRGRGQGNAIEWYDKAEFPLSEWPGTNQGKKFLAPILKDALGESWNAKDPAQVNKFIKAINSLIESRKTDLDAVEESSKMAKPPSTGIVGMGGATPEEFGKPGDFVSNMFAAIDRDRVARGEKPMEPGQTRGWDEDNRIALAKMNRDPQWIPNLLEEVSKNPRPLLSWENAGVTWQRAHWKAEASNAMKRLGEAFDDNRLQDMEDAKKDIARYEQGLNFLDSVVGRGGTGSEAGRSLRAQAMGAGEDFTLYDMVNRTRAARGGGPVTAEEMSKFAKQEAEWKAKNEQLQKTIAEKEKRIAEVEAQKALAEIEARSVKRVSTYDKRILDYAESIVKKMESAADSARDRILARRREGRQYVGIPVEELADYAIIGSAKIARGIKDFAAWSDAMKNELGDWISADLKQIWDASHASLTETLKDKSEPVKRVIRKGAKQKDLDQIFEDNVARIQKKVDAGEKKKITPQVKALAEVFWDRGIRKLDPMIEALQAVLKESMPDIDRLQTLDALSGRGVFTRPSQIEVKKGIRDLSQQARLVGHQIDVEAGRPLPRTGPQRDPMSPEARREQAKLNELKRRFGVVITDPKAQLESALGQAKTYIRNRLADMAEEIRRREKFVKSKTALVPDAELAALKQEYSDMKKDWDQVFPRQPLTPEQRIAAANRGLDRAISALESDLEAGRLFPEKRGATPVDTPELTEKRAWLAALREQRQELRDIANPKKTPLERALQTRKTRIANRIAELEQRLAEGNFEPKPRREPPIDADVLRLLVEKEKIEKAFNRGVELDKLKRRTKLQKAVAIAKESLNLPRNVMSSWDVSAVLRQGGFFAFSHPFRAAKSIGPMFRALVSEDRTLATELEILNRPNAPLYKKSKLYLAPHDSLKLSAQEEAIMSSISDKIPGVKHSNRAYITFLNKLRADSFDAMKSAIERPERPLTQPELMAIADYINTATGRGMHRIDRMPGLAEGLAGIFFSPRLVASRFQMLGRPLEGFRQGGETSFRVRRAVAEDYARFAIGIGTILSLGALAGGTIEFDPRSADFGKIRFGKTRVDPLAGLGQVTVLLSRVLSGQTKNERGQIKSLTAEGAKYGGQTIPGVIGNFLRSKLSPVTGAALDIRYGKNVVGEKMTWKDIPERMLIPLSWGDVLNVMEEQGVPRGTAIEILSLMGMGVQHYDDMNRRQ